MSGAGGAVRDGRVGGMARARPAGRTGGLGGGTRMTTPAPAVRGDPPPGVNPPAPAPAPALVDGSFEAFLARQRDRAARHPGSRGYTWGGAPRKKETEP